MTHRIPSPIRAMLIFGIALTLVLLAFAPRAGATRQQVVGSASCDTSTGLVNLAVTVSGDPGRDYRGIEAVIVSETLTTAPSIIGTTVKGDELVQSSQIVGLEYAATYTYEVAVQFANHAAGDLVTNRAVITPTFTECLPPIDLCPNVDGNQADVPAGLTIIGGNCVTPPIICPDGTVVNPCAPVVTDPPLCDPDAQACVDVPATNEDPLVKTGVESDLAWAAVWFLLFVGIPLIGYATVRRRRNRV